MRIVLASTSASRLSVLRSGGVEPVLAAPVGVDEDALLDSLSDASAAEKVAQLARAKAHAVAGKFPGEVVIGGDSMLLIEGQLQGKPHTPEVAIERWKNQRGKTAELLSGHCLIGPEGQEYVETASTTLRFASPSDADIAAYVATGEPLPCAGAFTLEAIGGWFIDNIDGDPSGVIGLSLPVVRRGLYSFGLDVHEFFSPELTRPAT
ncbi:Maf family protein [Corynebacterium aquilae]|uniref:Nucleoside triphosphate pyrophosphatase n=1 Tax=Corynebacterium aquilae DSM 44791 TaxID=1431546 RepID=A0A1L7CE59_9CORY|nr:nucleoside triphosphate pyrophosphatase [Corynebacterium aquilae]APT84160.1 septum formation inhibitor Maf [Corynebacterium aquilae DSM 44791]